MVCGAEVRKDLAGVIGLTPTRVTKPTWVDHRYSCTYEYPKGTLTLSVKELDSAQQTQSYFDQLATRLGRRPDNASAEQSAFGGNDGSVIVRKDWKVLLVDVSRLPAEFGQPPAARGDLAGSISETVMGCWTGA